MVDAAVTIAEPLVAGFETFSATPYHGADDRPDVWSIGYGFITNPDGSAVGPHTPPITKAEADARLSCLLATICASVRAMVYVPISDNSCAALCSFAYNEGTKALRTSTLLSRLNQRDMAGASICFSQWVYSNQKYSRGLVTRRKVEAELFMRGSDGDPADELMTAELAKLNPQTGA